MPLGEYAYGIRHDSPYGICRVFNSDLAAKTRPIGVRNPSYNVRGAMNCATTNAYILKFTPMHLKP